MNDRTDLQQMLETVLGSANVYFQPPESFRMTYPAIRYERDDIRNYPADNSVYGQSHHYKITVIDKNPDSAIVDALSRVPKMRFVTHYTSDNLNHDVFEYYY